MNKEIPEYSKESHARGEGVDSEGFRDEKEYSPQEEYEIMKTRIKSDTEWLQSGEGKAPEPGSSTEKDLLAKMKRDEERLKELEQLLGIKKEEK